ncbi:MULTISPECIES: TetR/AcrR family transcriptional regulator [Mycobacteriaceae]|jgi:AcrR family transcriptional regulator|nr:MULTISPECIES: TetR/AcrR family transcriptional regulator [unclassified Mycobacterium]MDZ4266417.1 TetR/AcrR family transcriptional regulator [Mycobacterium sp.]MEE3066438.1 TetR/AcrR family transcriptional regulator [Actinomycetota bacterium]GAY17573.1 TetR family transcriptional regulator [Mycobacterium sp. shizuoka-1]
MHGEEGQMGDGATHARQRDPQRKERILTASAELVAERGYHGVALVDIGARAGIVGSGIYRHFPSKDAILVALLDRVMRRLSHGAGAIISTAPSDAEALSALVDDHVRIAVEDRAVLAVYHREGHNVAPEQQRRLRRDQRHYVEEWVHVLGHLRPDLADAELRVAVHAAIGAIQSTLFFRSGLPPVRLAELLRTAAHGCLGVAPAPDIVNQE